MELNIVAPPKPRRNSASRKHKSSHGKRSRTSTHKHASGGPGESSGGSHARNGTKRDHKTGQVSKGGSKSVQRGRAPNAKRPRPSDNAGQDTNAAGTGATKRPRTADDAASDAAPAGTATGRGTRRNPVRLEPQRVSMIVDVADAVPITATAVKAAAGAGNGGGAGAGASRPGGQLVLGAARGIQGTGRIFRDGGTFGELGVSDQLVLQLTDRMKLKQPTQCQRLTVPVGLSGRDVMLKSETGSGKTLAFLLPIVHQLLALPQRCSRTDGTRAIILAPTRELCQQISRVLGDLIAPFRWIVAGSVTGGEKKKSEKARLRKGITILVCTPGRLLDHLETTACFNVSPLRFLVLDEADRLLDLGFEQQVTKILEAIASKQSLPANGEEATKTPATQARRQTFLISATMTEHVKRLAGLSMSNPVFLDADGPGTRKDVERAEANRTDAAPSGDGDADSSAAAASEAAPEAATVPERLVQRYIVVPAKWRLVTLLAMLRRSFAGQRSAKIVVFFSSCASVDFHYALMRRLLACMSGKTQKHVEELPPSSGGPLFRLHGNVPQVERTEAFRAFCAAKQAILFATDVAARGLDLPVVSWILQMDPPCETSDYVHRIGRTARGGMSGSAVLFLLPSETDFLTILGKHKLKLSAVANASVLTSLRDAVPPISEMLEATADDPNRSERRYRQLQRFSRKVGRKKGKKAGLSKAEMERELELGAVRWQVYMEELVSTTPSLAELARDGFTGYIRSYATHSKETKHIFHVRSLHFGHVAKSFALREQPKMASSKARQANEQTGSGAAKTKARSGTGKPPAPRNANAKRGARNNDRRGSKGKARNARDDDDDDAMRKHDHKPRGAFKAPSMQALTMSEFDA